MQFSCYCQENEKTMENYIYSFAKCDNIVTVEILFFSYLNGDLYEDNCKFFIDADKLQKLKNLYQIYLLSLELTESLDRLVFNDDSLYGYTDHQWGIKCRKHYIDKGFSKKYYSNYGFSQHPCIIFDKIKKDYNFISKYNKYSIRYYKKKYEKSFNPFQYMDLFINQEINNIASDLNLIEDDVQKHIMRRNVEIVREVLPDDIVETIKSIVNV